MIEIVLNGERKNIPAGLTVTSLLEHLEVDLGRVAVELNRTLVRKRDWPQTPVEANALVEVVHFVGGGRC
ncbi:MAG: sulfur carrier protein ThiS [Acidobacteria bacterium]|nr:sulfur carrier protein ThiS [Acidobacteriota bacterium]